MIFVNALLQILIIKKQVLIIKRWVFFERGFDNLYLRKISVVIDLSSTNIRSGLFLPCLRKGYKKAGAFSICACKPDVSMRFLNYIPRYRKAKPHSTRFCSKVRNENFIP